MAWCPQCKNEYVEGVTHCPDCDVDLVETLPPEIEENFFEEPSGIQQSQETEPVPYTKAYQEASYREREMKSSSVSFIIVGIILIAISAMVFMDVIPVAVHSTATKILDVSVLLVMSILFFMISFFSMKRAKQLAASSDEEVRQTEEIISFCTASYSDPASPDASPPSTWRTLCSKLQRKGGLRQSDRQGI